MQAQTPVMLAQAAEVQQQAEEEIGEIKNSVLHSGVIEKRYDPKLGNNCYAYAKSQGDVPMGVTTLEQKKSHIKVREPYVGAIGVTAESKLGHLVVVRQIQKDHLLIEEGNYIHGYVTTRWIPKDFPLGYF